MHDKKALYAYGLALRRGGGQRSAGSVRGRCLKIIFRPRMRKSVFYLIGCGTHAALKRAKPLAVVIFTCDARHAFL